MCAGTVAEPANCPRTARNWLASWPRSACCSSRRNAADAEPLLRECLAIREKTQPDIWTTFNTQSLLGGALLGQKKYAKRRAAAAQGLRGDEDPRKDDPAARRHPHPRVLDRLIELYTATNKPDEVKKWQAERAKYPAARERSPSGPENSVRWSFAHNSNRIQAVFLLAVEATDAAARARCWSVSAAPTPSCGNGSKLCWPHTMPPADFWISRPCRRFRPWMNHADRGAGSRIGPYKLLQQIGEGGMGVVYLAEQLEPVQRKVALKVIKPGMDTHQVVARFEAERQALALMDHPNIAKVLDAGATDSGRPYFVMELVKGLPITKYCDQEHLTPQERLHLFVPICHAVQHATRKGSSIAT